MDIELIVEGRIFKEWSDVQIDYLLNTVASTFTLSTWMDDSNKVLFEPLKFRDCEVWLVDRDKGFREKLITGSIVNQGLSTQKVPKLTTLNGFTKTGILENVTSPPSFPSLQYKDVGLRVIAKKFTDYFGLTLKVHPGAADAAEIKFKEEEIGRTESVKAFLSRLGRKRGITIAHDNLGNLLLYRIINTIPASSKITQDDAEISFSCSPNAQAMHSECTAYKESEIENVKEGTEYQENRDMTATVKSPFVKGIKLPTSIEVPEKEERSARELAEELLAREASNFPVIIRKEGWDFSGRIVRGGFYLDIEAPDIFFKPTKMLVDKMRFTKEANKPKFLELTCVLPCVYTGKLPSSTPFKYSS